MVVVFAIFSPHEGFAWTSTRTDTRCGRPPPRAGRSPSPGAACTPQSTHSGQSPPSLCSKSCGKPRRIPPPAVKLKVNSLSAYCILSVSDLDRGIRRGVALVAPLVVAVLALLVVFPHCLLHHHHLHKETRNEIIKQMKNYEVSLPSGYISFHLEESLQEVMLANRR